MKTEDVTVAEYLTYYINRSERTQREIAIEVGYYSNMITMLKQGLSGLPLNKVGPIAKAIEADAVYLFRLCLNEYYPETAKVIEDELEGLKLTEGETKMLNEFRALCSGQQYKRIKGVIFD